MLAPQVTEMAMEYSPVIGDAINEMKGLSPSYMKQAFSSVDNYLRDAALSLAAFNRGQEYEADLLGTQYAATAAVLALVVDLTRIPVYVALEGWQVLEAGWLIVGLVLAAILGVQLGKRWLKKWKSNRIRNGILVAIITSGVLYIHEALTSLELL